ncbi:MAG: glycosyltransferase family 2 protein [Deltaproteobacteria bacterium]|nr:glycosyltransferase family 2 protein [Deltaproteobacteria bacterium]
MTESIPLSAIIITLNEEGSLRRCLESLPPCEIIVVDSGSSDRTLEIAKQWGASVYLRDFDNYAAQKNFAVSKATRPWVLSVDADEVLDETLRTSIKKITGTKHPSCEGYRVRRSLVFMGRKLRFGKARDEPLRLFRNGSAKFVDEIHEKVNIEGAVKTLAGEILHYSYENLDDYFSRFNLYTHKIAWQHYKQKVKVPIFKHIVRPWFEFTYRYFFRLGFLDGFAGYSYALISSLYAFVKYEKLRELYLMDKVSESGR